MSWHFKYHAASKAMAKQALERVHAPSVVKKLVAQAIDGLRDDTAGFDGVGHKSIKDKVIHVCSNGHLAIAGDVNSYETSTCQTTVEWVFVIPDGHFAEPLPAGAAAD